MDGGLYETDFPTWTVLQAAALRRFMLRRGNTELDLEHLAEEIEDLGRSEVRAVISLLARLMEHAALVALAPETRDAAHWRGEMSHFRLNAAEAYQPSMRGQVEPALARTWEAAREAATRKRGLDGEALPVEVPFALENLLSRASLDALAERVWAAAG